MALHDANGDTERAIMYLLEQGDVIETEWKTSGPKKKPKNKLAGMLKCLHYCNVSLNENLVMIGRLQADGGTSSWENLLGNSCPAIFRNASL